MWLCYSAWLEDLHVYDPVAMSWTELHSNNAPSARYGHGFTFTSGKIWIHGGYGFIAATDGYGERPLRIKVYICTK